MLGQPISIQCLDPVMFVEALVALDGWAGRILSLEATCATERRASLEKQIGAAWRVKTAAEGLQFERIGPATTVVGPTEWVIPTSGTTGPPKLVAHSFESLTQTLKRASVGVGERRWGLFYECTRFAGIQVIVQALGGGGRLIVADDISDLLSSTAFLARHGCDALSATPTLWRKLAIAGLLSTLDLRLVTLGGEAADQKILNVLLKAFPHATVRHIYASTEAGVGFSVTDGKAGFPTWMLRQPPAGVELKVRDDGMLLLRRGGVAPRLVAHDGHMTQANGWIESGDLVKDTGERYVFVGRADGAINVGGRKVHPATIEQLLLEVPGVNAARVFGQRNPIVGALVVAEIVADPGHDIAALRKHLSERCEMQLERFERPVRFMFVDEVTSTSAGKMKR